MPGKSLYIVLALLLLGLADVGAQTLRNNKGGVINNSGKIVTRGVSSVDSAKIKNPGELVVDGVGIMEQDSIDGMVRYVRDDATQRQLVPQITYRNIEFSGVSEKVMELDKPIIAIESVTTTDDKVELILGERTEFIAEGTVRHEGNVNPAKRFGLFTLGGKITSQDISGKGAFKVLRLDNGNGADVRDSGGFSINRRLELLNGELRNNTVHNFRLDDSVLIIRHVNGSLAAAPLFSDNVSVTYTGNGSIIAGEELPTSETTLRNMRVENTGGLALSKSVTVNDTLYLASNIDTEPGGERHVLTHASMENPIFANPDIEIRGTIRRTALVAGNEQNVFNNQYTFATFNTEDDMANVKGIAVRVLNDTVPLPNDIDNSDKVRRSITVSAEDADGAAVNEGFNAGFNYAWRRSPVDETNNLPVEELQLQHFESGAWANVSNTSAEENIHVEGNWITGYAPIITRSGYYAIGVGDVLPTAIVAINIFLEGPFNGSLMSTDLWDEGLLPNTPPNRYPYTLDVNRPFIQMGEVAEGVDIVDWVVVEFRTSISGGVKKYKTGLLTSTGRIVDYRNGNTDLQIDSGTYYVVVHHRNHLSVITEKEQNLAPHLTYDLDFTRASLVLGGSSSMKVVQWELTGRQYFAMFAGDANGDGKILRDDYDAAADATWQQHDAEGYSNADTDMNGIVTTKDANVTWNNQGEESKVVR